MKKMPMCPMMMQQMPMMQMPMMQMPMMQMPMQQMPMQQMPMMHGDMCEMEHEMDDMDERYFAGMHSEACHHMMPYVKRVLDRMEEESDILDEEQPKREMVEGMIEEAYGDMVKDMPEMADEKEEERQYYGPRRFARDLLGVLLINELIGRRRRRRRRRDHFYPGYGYDYDFYDYDYYDYD